MNSFKLIFCLFCGIAASLVANQLVGQDVQQPLEPISNIEGDLNEPQPQISVVEREQPVEEGVLERKPAPPSHQLQTTHANDLLAITNEELRREVEWLAREYRESERMNFVLALSIGGGIALIFFGLGYWLGRRSNQSHFL